MSIKINCITLISAALGLTLFASGCTNHHETEVIESINTVAPSRM